MESKSLVGMYTELDNCLISSECCHSFSQLLVSMFAQWYFYSIFHSFIILDNLNY